MWLVTVDFSRLFFVDETGTKTNMTRSRGRARKGQRVYGSAPGRWDSTTVIGAISQRHGLSSLMTMDGALNGELFVAWVERFLVPELSVGDVVVLDNLSVHKSAEAKALIESAGAEVRFLPPYHPELNPIELAWNKLKTSLRRIQARCTKTLDQAIVTAVDEITPNDVANWFKHSLLKLGR